MPGGWRSRALNKTKRDGRHGTTVIRALLLSFGSAMQLICLREIAVLLILRVKASKTVDKGDRNARGAEGDIENTKTRVTSFLSLPVS